MANKHQLKIKMVKVPLPRDKHQIRQTPRVDFTLFNSFRHQLCQLVTFGGFRQQQLPPSKDRLIQIHLQGLKEAGEVYRILGRRFKDLKGYDTIFKN